MNNCNLLPAVGDVVLHHDDDVVVGDAVLVEDLIGVTHVRLRATVTSLLFTN